MGRRSDHSREELTALALKAAREIVEEDGLRGLTARLLANKIGYAPGTLYNLFDGLDGLVGVLNAETLNNLMEFVSDVSLEGEPDEVLRALARRYQEFIDKHPNLWSALFDPAAPHGKALPQTYWERLYAVLGVVEGVLAPLFAPGQDDECLHAARTLWAALHGYCSLQSAGIMAEGESVERMTDTLIDNFIAGVRGRN